MAAHSLVLPTRTELEDFFFREALLLDEWRLNDWLELFSQEGEVHYLVPALDIPDGDYRESLFLIADDRKSVQSRVRQLLGKAAWAETPRSRTRRLITNVQLLQQRGDELTVTANFAVWRFQHGTTDTYVGRYVHALVRDGAGTLRFRERKAVLDLETLRPHGKLSFIL